jgi:hypothetical protein
VNSLEIENNEDDWQAKNEEQNEKNNPKSVHVVPTSKQTWWLLVYYMVHSS